MCVRMFLCNRMFQDVSLDDDDDNKVSNILILY